MELKISGLNNKIEKLEKLIKDNELDKRLFTKGYIDEAKKDQTLRFLFLDSLYEFDLKHKVSVYTAVLMLLDHLGLEIERNREPIEYVLTEKEDER